MTGWAVVMVRQLLCTFMQVHMPYWNFEWQRLYPYTVVEVGGSLGQGPATEVTHLALHQIFPVFFCWLDQWLVGVV